MSSMPPDAMMPLSHSQLTRQLRNLHIAGSVLLVHCAFSKVKRVEGGRGEDTPGEDTPLGLLAALLEALGPRGTLVMPSMTEDDDHPFDARSTPCTWLGVLADTFWRQPGVLRSDNPHAFAALGLQAAHITAPHPFTIPHGLDSPVGRVYELDGRVLLLGVDHTANTTIHLCEALAGVRYRRPKHVTVLQDGQPTRVVYGETDHCCQRFALVDGWLEARGVQKKGIVGRAEARLIRSRDIVETVLPRLLEEETIFLHPFGVDEECDEARGSLAGLTGWSPGF